MFIRLSPAGKTPLLPCAPCVITANWVGATAEDVENLVTDPIEEAVETLDEVRQIRSQSFIGKAIIKVDLLKEGLPVNTIDNVWG